ERKYSGYLERERAGAGRLNRMESVELPADAPYRSFRSLSFESREKMIAIRPATLAQAGRIPGVSPSDLQTLLIDLAQWPRRSAPCFAGNPPLIRPDSSERPQTQPKPANSTR